MTTRTCPHCSNDSVDLGDLVFSDATCASCGAVVRVHPMARIFWNLLIAAVAIPSTFVVGGTHGYFAAIVWFPFPVGSISYLKAWFSPLVSDSDSARMNNSHVA
ncbi:MAG: hypothetical protein AAF578_04690 [Pseudomonadota bacterium]